MTHNAVLAVISLLAEKWPCCFSIIESGRRPLKLGGFGDICWAASAHKWTWQILPDYPCRVSTFTNSDCVSLERPQAKR